MDYSNYKEDHPLYDTSKKSQLGYFKDELDSDSKCVEFVGLRSKCYALKIKKNESSHKNKISLLLYETKKHYHVLIQKDGFLIVEFILHRLVQYSLIVLRISVINA